MARASNPVVTVVLVLYGRAELTLACLRSIAEHGGHDIEVVIVDNASTDRTPQLLERVDGATIVRNDTNVGFVLAVNQAAAHGSGELVLLLNNDANLRPGTMAAAVNVLRLDPLAGVVGGPLVLADGLLQEAGSIVYDDGSCEGFARGRRPDDPEVQFRREVDFVSGAFLLTRRVVWDELGGFDESYAPAYYEDVDYCARAWQAGWRVIYEPDAVADHYEYGSSAHSDWAAQQMRANRETFRQRHAQWLSRQPSREDPPHLVRSRDRRRRVLVIDDRVPLPYLGSGGPRMTAVIRALGELGFAVTFYSKLPREGSWPEIRAALGADVETAGFDEFAGLAEMMMERAGCWEAVIVSRHHNAERVQPILDRARPMLGEAKIIYDAEALATNRVVSRRAVLGPPLDPEEAERLITAEVELASFADRVVAVSEREAEAFRRLGTFSVVVAGHGLACHSVRGAPFSQRSGFLFVGALTDEGSPNVDALGWFLEEVLPLTNALLGRDLDGEVQLTVAGRVRAQSLLSRRSSQVRFLGPVDDLSPLYEQARVFIAPTRFAAGIPLKLLETGAHGVPSVTTRLLADQLGWEHEREVLVGELDPEHFAEQCARLYLDHELWRRIRGAARARVVAEHSPDAMRRAAQAMVEAR